MVLINSPCKKLNVYNIHRINVFLKNPCCMINVVFLINVFFTLHKENGDQIVLHFLFLFLNF